MLFNSFAYVFLFLPVVAVAYAIARQAAGQRSAQFFLLLSSLFFYGYAKPGNLPLLAGSILFNWAIARRIGSAAPESENEGSGRKLFLWVGIAGDIAFLSCFKYANFFLGPWIKLPVWEFPLGISFFTLTQIMYLVDTYQGLNQPNSLFDHATLVSLFPYVSAGPLVRSRAIVPQFKDLGAAVNPAGLACRGFYLFAIGLAKKVVLADSFARIADVGFGSGRSFSTLEAWMFCLSYTFQIYFDFSGYSDMAVGSAWMLGIDIPQNFNAPYIAKSIGEFWQRWHISLSNFITNYLYTPILRSMGKATIHTAVVATLVSMAIVGLWHGAAATYIVFGTLHGCALAVNQIWKKRKMKMPDWFGWLLTFVFVNIAFVFFRSPNIAAALHLLTAMLPHVPLFATGALKGVLPLTPLTILRPVTVGVVLAFFFKTSQKLAENFQPTRANAFATAVLVLLSLFFMNSTPAKEFVYFAF